MIKFIFGITGIFGIAIISLLLTTTACKAQLMPNPYATPGLYNPGAINPGLYNPGAINPRLLAANPYLANALLARAYQNPGAVPGAVDPRLQAANPNQPAARAPAAASSPQQGCCRSMGCARPMICIVYCPVPMPPAAPTNKPVQVNVRVPAADAEVWLEGTKTNQKGLSRNYQSPPLDAGWRYVYEVRAQWQEGSTPVTQTRFVPVRPGDVVSVDFTIPAEKAVASNSSSRAAGFIPEGQSAGINPAAR